MQFVPAHDKNRQTQSTVYILVCRNIIAIFIGSENWDSHVTYSNLSSIGVATLDNRHGEMLHEVRQSAKLARKDEVK